MFGMLLMVLIFCFIVALLVKYEEKKRKSELVLIMKRINRPIQDLARAFSDLNEPFNKAKEGFIKLGVALGEIQDKLEM